MARLSVHDLLSAVFEERSVWEFPVTDPAVLAGEARLRGRRVAWVAGDGDHMGGSIGVNGGEFGVISHASSLRAASGVVTPL